MKKLLFILVAGGILFPAVCQAQLVCLNKDDICSEIWQNTLAKPGHQRLSNQITRAIVQKQQTFQERMEAWLRRHPEFTEQLDIRQNESGQIWLTAKSFNAAVDEYKKNVELMLAHPELFDSMKKQADLRAMEQEASGPFFTKGQLEKFLTNNPDMVKDIRFQQMSKLSPEDLQDYHTMVETLDNFRNLVRSSRGENPAMLMQSLLSVSDTFFNLYAKDPAKKATSFEAKKPELLPLVISEIEKPISVGWAEQETVVISSYLQKWLSRVAVMWNGTVEAELDVFKDVLRRDSSLAK
ncbi:MAG: hypothetical protein IKO35_00750 [Elusimicrobiaceae bacterium]|nr:hypothetical protein [Elusimicrobiaceae bacterium]